MRNLVSNIVDRSPTVLSSSASYSWVTFKANSSNLDLNSLGNLVFEIWMRTQHRVLKCRNQMWIQTFVQGNPWRKRQNTHWCKIVSPLLEDMQDLCRSSWESLFRRTTKIWSSIWRRHVSDRGERDDLWNKSCPQRRKQRSILDKIIKITCVPLRTWTSTRSNKCLIFQRNWSWMQDCNFHGW